MDIVADSGQDIKLSDLLSQTDAARQLGKNAWQIQRLILSNKLEAVRLPNGHRAVVRASLEAYRQRTK